ncbi:MAG: hypothetical protein LBE59_01065 [Nevskiaceae bacterium]|jgi:hypothetical protein|nr:hypothetical protein [Nevskiaceae bacterium]
MRTSNLLKHSLPLIGVAVLAAITACSPRSADQSASSANTSAAANGAFDPRDFSGTWDRLQQAAAPRDVGTLVPAADARDAIPPPPLKPEYKAAWEEQQRKIRAADLSGAPIATHYTACIPDGMPAMMQGMFPMEVLITPRQVTVIQEAYNQVRRIYFNDTLPAVEDAEPGFWGHSTGHWDGNDFVVETIGIKDRVRFRNVQHSPEMRIFERMRMTDADHFENDVTIEDPQYLAEPWKWTWKYQRRPDYKMYEYVCEDNREYADPVTGEARLRVGE